MLCLSGGIMRICIIGGGIVGLNIAYTLATSKMLKNSEIYLFETEPYLGHHASSRNSEVIHAGLSYPEGSLKARLCIEGKYLTYDLLKRLNVPVNRSGKWIIAINEDELEALEKMAANAHRCGATEVSMSKPREALAAEPSLQNITGAAYSPTSGIMDTAAYIKALEVALSNLNNVNLIFPCKIDWLGNDQLLSERGEMEYDIAINAAGLFADDIYRSAGGTKKYQIIPYKGEYYTWRSGRINSLIYPVPQKFLKANQNDPTKMGNFGIHLHRKVYCEYKHKHI